MLNKKNIRFPVVSRNNSHFPKKPLCPWCKKRKVFEPHSMVVLGAGALLLLDKEIDYKGKSDDMDGYLDLWWHGAHDEGLGENREIDVRIEIARDVKGGQLALMFCSTECLRNFLNYSIDTLEEEINKAKKK